MWLALINLLSIPSRSQNLGLRLVIIVVLEHPQQWSYFFLAIWHHKKLLYLFYLLILQNIQSSESILAFNTIK